MKIHSDSFEHGKPIPPDFAMGARDGEDGFGGNRNPHLSWSEAPEGTRSFVLLCIDTDAPTDGSLVADDSIDIPVAHPRGDFVHWAVVDIPAEVHAIAAGSCSDGITPRGKPAGNLRSRPSRARVSGWLRRPARLSVLSMPSVSASQNRPALASR